MTVDIYDFNEAIKKTQAELADPDSFNNLPVGNYFTCIAGGVATLYRKINNDRHAKNCVMIMTNKSEQPAFIPLTMHVNNRGRNND